ncbi:MAG TPA: carboxypeptidase-like regulatory domain-containing protein [Candidatus Paceibacterota bacterium]|nr:carboxypeptidase-like regulatory domain-containing protein [Candidatus Paceibacterota bacterium]
MFIGFLSGTAVLLDIAAKGYGSDRAVVETKDTQTNRYEFPTFVLLRADRKIAGRVLDEAGKPIAGAEVYFMGKGQPMNSGDKWGQQPWCNTKTDSEGNFSFDNVCNAPLRVYADAHNGGGMKYQEAQAGDTNIIIRLSAPNR